MGGEQSSHGRHPDLTTFQCLKNKMFSSKKKLLRPISRAETMVNLALIKKRSQQQDDGKFVLLNSHFLILRPWEFVS